MSISITLLEQERRTGKPAERSQAAHLPALRRCPTRFGPFTHRRGVRRARRGPSPSAGLSCLNFPVCKMELTALVAPRDFSRRLTFPKALSHPLSDLSPELLLRLRPFRVTQSLEPKKFRNDSCLFPLLHPLIRSVTISLHLPLNYSSLLSTFLHLRCHNNRPGRSPLTSRLPEICASTHVQPCPAKPFFPKAARVIT